MNTTEHMTLTLKNNRNFPPTTCVSNLTILSLLALFYPSHTEMMDKQTDAEKHCTPYHYVQPLCGINYPSALILYILAFKSVV